MMTNLIRLMTFWLALALAPDVSAARIYLVPTLPITGVQTGDIVAFDVMMNFTFDPTYSGGFDIAFDHTALEFVSFFRNPTLGDPQFSRDPDVLPGLLESWTIASFSPLPDMATMGSVVFAILPTMGQTTNVNTQATNGIGGPWLSALDFGGTLIDVDYQGERISRVPIPAAIWLFLGGLTTLAGLTRHGAMRPNTTWPQERRVR